MVLLSSITIAVEKEGNVYRSYAYGMNDENIAIAKSFDSGLAISSLFDILRGIALDKEVAFITGNENTQTGSLKDRASSTGYMEAEK